MKNLFFLIFAFLFVNSFSQEIDFSKLPQLQTKATYTTEVTPDKITLSIVLSEVNTKGKISVEELESRLQQVLQENKIDINKQLKLIDLQSNFKNYFFKKNDVQKTKNYELVVYDANVAGKILRDLEQKEISNIELQKIEFTKIEELKIELKGKAILKAKMQAEEMVKPLNQKLGNAIYISDLDTNYSRLLSGKASGLNIGVNGISVNEKIDLNVEFEKIKVDATVTVYFKLD